MPIRFGLHIFASTKVGVAVLVPPRAGPGEKVAVNHSAHLAQAATVRTQGSRIALPGSPRRKAFARTQGAIRGSPAATDEADSQFSGPVDITVFTLNDQPGTITIAAVLPQLNGPDGAARGAGGPLLL